MSRTESVVALRARVKELEADLADRNHRCASLLTELEQWKQDYKDLALAIAQREESGSPLRFPRPTVTPAAPIPAPPLLPPDILAAIEGTTEPHSDARMNAFQAAREMLEQGATAESVAEQIRLGAEVKV